MNYPIYYTTIALLSIIVYLVITEPNFLRFIDVQSKIFSIQLRKYFILIRLYPRIKWDLFLLKMRMSALKRKQEESSK